MKAAFYQFNPVFGKTRENLAHIVSSVRDADIDLLVLPEFFATGYQFASRNEVEELSEQIPGGDTTTALSELSREKGCYVVAGVAEREGDRFFNSAVLTGPRGFMGAYRKTHLFFEEKLYFSPGNTGFQVWETNLGRIGIMICFDWFFPESMRTLALMGAEVVAHPSNLVLPHCPQGMVVRCLENRVYAVTANRTGVESRKEGQSLRYIGQSQIVSPEGKVLVRASEEDEVFMVADIDPVKADDKSINRMNNLFLDRRPEMYGEERGMKEGG